MALGKEASVPAVFQTPATILTGAGCFDEIGPRLAALGKRCLIVTGKQAMQEQGILGKAVALLEKEGVAAGVFTGVESDPSLATVDKIRERLREEERDVVLALGGGSALDAAKAAAALALESEPTRAYFDGREISSGGLPLAAAPSTFGTGAEATMTAVLSDPERTLKKSLRHPNLLPKVALVDPVLGMGAPPQLTAACGMDALTQAIESYLSKNATDLTQALSFSAVVLLLPGLPKAYADGHDLEARENCANGSLMAGIALHNARLGIVHGLAHPLGARYGLRPGEVCGTLLPYALRYNQEAAAERYELLSGIFGRDAADFCFALLQQLDLPTDLKPANIPSEDFPAIAAAAMLSGSTQANPRAVTEADITVILESACQ